MSLINDALKRARVEAAREEAAQRGVPVTALPTHVPRQRRGWLGPVAGLLVGLLIAGGAWFLSAGGGRSARGPLADIEPRPSAGPLPTDAAPTPIPSSSGPAEQKPAEPIPAALSPGAQASSTPASVNAASSERPMATPPATEARRPAAPPRQSTASEPAASTPAEPIATIQAPPPPQRAPTPRPEQTTRPTSGTPATLHEQVHRKEAMLANGKSIRLDFIVWSESRPFAQINGQLVGLGEGVYSYTLAEVLRDRIRLQGEDGSLVIRTP